MHKEYSIGAIPNSYGACNSTGIRETVRLSLLQKALLPSCCHLAVMTRLPIFLGIHALTKLPRVCFCAQFHLEADISLTCVVR